METDETAPAQPSAPKEAEPLAQQSNGTAEVKSSTEEANPDVNLLDLLASAATSQQAEVPTVAPPPEPIIPAALLEHDYYSPDDPPPEDPNKMKK